MTARETETVPNETDAEFLARMGQGGLPVQLLSDDGKITLAIDSGDFDRLLSLAWRAEKAERLVEALRKALAVDFEKGGDYYDIEEILTAALTEWETDNAAKSVSPEQAALRREIWEIDNDTE